MRIKSIVAAAFIVNSFVNSVNAEDIVVEIVGQGGQARYIQVGHAVQEPVQANVGDRIKWVNRGNRTHTATALRILNGNALFTTGDITQSNESGFIELNQQMYEDAGGQPMGAVDLDYECDFHPNMQASIVLSAATITPTKEQATGLPQTRASRAGAGVTARAPFFVRKDVNSLSTVELTALQNGVRVMKSRPANSRTSWTYWANIHGTLSSVSDPLWNQCEHGSFHFLTWHRAFLYQFELVLREASGDPSLTLPYWNWTNDRIVPAPYRFPANPSNSLWESNRMLNNGAALPASVVLSDLNTAIGQGSFFNFSSLLEGPVHGNVHVLVGGPGGTMSSISTSTNDPIFWAHHANVDRLWNRWLDRPQHRNPSDPAFLNRSFTFVNPNGANVTVTVRDTISNLSLGYVYDDDPRPALTIAANSSRGTGSETVATNLGFTPHVARIEVPKPLSSMRSSRELSTSGSKVWIDIKGIEFDETPSFVYGAYLNLPAGVVDQETLDAHYIGSISLFGGDPKHDEKGLNRSLDATETIKRLLNRDLKLGEQLDITLRPITLVPAEGRQGQQLRRDENSAKEAKVIYRSMSVRLSPE